MRPSPDSILLTPEGIVGDIAALELFLRIGERLILKGVPSFEIEPEDVPSARRLLELRVVEKGAPMMEDGGYVQLTPAGRRFLVTIWRRCTGLEKLDA